MGRVKQKPKRSVGISEQSQEASTSKNPKKHKGQNGHTPYYYVDIDKTNWGELTHRDVSEIVLRDLNYGSNFVGFDSLEGGEFEMRLRVSNVSEHVGRMIKLGHWPVMSLDDVCLEMGVKKIESFDVLVSGGFDGSDEGVSGLVHLVSLSFLSLRPVFEVGGFGGGVVVGSVRLRVEVLQSAFDACECLLESGRQVWKRSMMSVMAWLRPEVSSSEARYGVKGVDGVEGGGGGCIDGDKSKFDVGRFYEALKRSKDCPMLDVELPELVPELRPYQSRAAHWMIEREKGASLDMAVQEQSFANSPFCVAVTFLDSCSKMFYNPFSGTISLCPEIPSSYVGGGILADEMGLGKTVELLACVLGHRKSSPESSSSPGSASDTSLMEEIGLKRVKRERVECICGALSESYRYKGLWVQCDVCDAWQHADCVGYNPSKRRKRSTETSGELQVNDKKKKKGPDIVMMDDQYICNLCSELMLATGAPIDSAATLIVCPTPILPQWHSEILRHTSPGSLRIYIYEGVKEISLSNLSPVDVNELAAADIVLTTYDILKEDLSHDSERHDGDRRLMRYEKRYRVIPTLLTRVYWWRVCLDEAQMVESNVAAAAEMALRLPAQHRWCITGTPIQRKLDDLYGLLKFLKASPFDVFRLWAEAIRDPYERRDQAAMEFTHKLFRQLMWRSSKSHVEDELQLPSQEECISWLSFSPVEEHFYQRQYETCVDVAYVVLERFKSDRLKRDSSGSSSCDSLSDPYITHLEAAKLLNSLLKLRQACCHPQVGGSGLRSLHQSPMTMDEILSVLITKTRVEGEESLRKVVSSLNGLAGIAMIREELSQGESLYKEALALAEEHSEDFRLDPLLNLHIHFNLADILKTSLNTWQAPCHGQESNVVPEEKRFPAGEVSKFSHLMKKQKVSEQDFSEMTGDAEFSHSSRDGAIYGPKSFQDCKSESHLSHNSTVEGLFDVCENLKQKHLSAFCTRLSQSQQDFRKSYAQVSELLHDKEKNSVWWLEALQQIEQSKEAASELLRKVEDAVMGNKNAKSSRTASRFSSTMALKYYIQSGLDSLEESRKSLFARLIEVDDTMRNPREEDIERIRYCPICCCGDGNLCVHCEMDELFQAYEARLFLKTGDDGGVIASAEDAVDLQKRKGNLNKYFWNLEQKDSASLRVQKKRDVGKMVVVTKSPCELDIIFGVLRSSYKKQLGREGVSAASRHLLLLEGMRKEYAHARSLSISQAQVLRAYDEIKMATSRLRLKKNEDDNSIDALTWEELDIASVQNSSEKFVSLEDLGRIRGKLRYLQGLMLSKQTSGSDDKLTAPSGPSTEKGNESKAAEEICPVCQEDVKKQRMVFQCGHFTCCKCLFAITEWREAHNGKLRDKWVMCPTCRQHSDFESIAFADDRQNRASIERCEDLEASIAVQGSYGTKVEAITKRILWIKSREPKAKILVFSSWNDVLEVLEHAFAANKISYVRMKGGRKRSQAAINMFKGEKATEVSCKRNGQEQQEDNFIQVLLLLIQHGANGLNLLEAQHVILVEPLLNPATEAQAISRVHRIGQTSKTLVHRFMVKNTVEESLYKLNKSRNSSSFISGNKKNQDQPILTLKDVESLFASAPPAAATNPAADGDEEQTQDTGGLRHLPPSVAAALAAERRLNETTT